MSTVDDRAVGPHSSDTADHERLVLEARNVDFDWTKLPFHYVPNEPLATHVLNVLHLLLPAGEEFFVEVFKKTLPLIRDDDCAWTSRVSSARSPCTPRRTPGCSPTSTPRAST